MSIKDDKQMIDELKNMPDIIDDMDKEELYKQISLRLSEEASPKIIRKRKILIPFLATATVLLFLISLPFLFNLSNDHAVPVHDSADSENNTLMEQESSAVSEADSDESIQENIEEAKIMMDTNDAMDMVEESRVIESIPLESQLVYFTIYDAQLQFVIPITYVVSENEEADNVYKEMNSILASENLLPEDYIFDEVNFQLDDVNNKVILNLPEDFTLGDGSSRAGMFQEMLKEMFLPKGFEKVVFESDGENEVDLGAIGEVKEIAFTEQRESSYMIYQEQYFVPVPHEEAISITEAIQVLKKEIPEFDISHTIPADVEFQIEENNTELILEYNGIENIDESQFNMTMVESLLLTAKSFGYESVLFKNMPVDEIGIYHFSEPMQVPVGVNPIYESN